MKYEKQFLIDAFIWRYSDILLNDTCEAFDAYVKMVSDFYDKVTPDKFRTWCSLDADEIRKFRLATGQ